MRIGIDARMLNNTGIGRYLRNLLIQLAAIDTNNEYIIFVNPENLRIIDHTNVMFVPFTSYLPVYSLREQYMLPIQIRKWNIDLMHYPNFNVPLFPYCPYVVTIHDLIYYLYPEECPSKMAHYYAKYMLRYAAKHARIVMTVSNHSKNDLMRYFHLHEDRIRVILNAPDTKIYPASRSRHTHISNHLQKKYGISDPYVLYVGKHHRYKNIITLLHAFIRHQAIFEQFQLVIAGKRDSRQQALYDMAAAMDPGTRIIFTDFVSDDDIFKLYQQASLFVFPSLYEGFGLPPLEAMACGVPVITSCAASLPEIVGDAAIVVDPSDVTAMADAMQHVLTDTHLWHTLREKGLQHAQTFSWERAARQLLEVYTTAYG